MFGKRLPPALTPSEAVLVAEYYADRVATATEFADIAVQSYCAARTEEFIPPGEIASVRERAENAYTALTVDSDEQAV